MLGNLAARGGGAVPGRMLALAAVLDGSGDLSTIFDELDPSLASALATLITAEQSKAKYGTGAAPKGIAVGQ